jgi:hypothetical protein
MEVPRHGRIHPTPEDRFAFGDATRPPPGPVESVHRLAVPGAYGVTFHDDLLAAGPGRAEASCENLANDDFDLDAADARGYHYTRLNQLAVEHLLGVR